MNTPVPEGSPGRVGPYQIERLLGGGGMGVVYLGHHTATGAPAAVKLIRPEYAADLTFRARLRREITAAQQVPRFCTAAVLGADVDATPPWIATEYIDAPTLDVALVGRGPLTGADLETFAMGVAAALRAIHAHGVVHRDLKPSNVLMSPQGPRVIDFGIARPADPADQLTRLTHTGYAIGTPAYMAPEQVAGGAVTPAVDVYAWARLVSYAAIGRPPAAPDATAGPDARPELGALPEPLRTLVTAALHPEPGDRPTAADLVDRLTAHRIAPPPAPATATHVPAPAPVTPSAPAPPSRRAHDWWLPVIAAVTTVAVLAVVAVTAVLIWPRESDTRSPGAGDRPDAGPTDDPGADQPPFGFQVVGPLTGHTDGVEAVAIGELDGTPIAASSSQDDTVRLWDLTTGDQIGEPLTGHTHDVWGVALGELDGTPIAVTGSHDETVRVWDLTTGDQIGEPFTGHTNNILGLAVGELDGTPIAVSASADGTVRVWDLSTGSQTGEFTGHTDPVWVVALGELDGTPIAVSGSVDRTVRVWDVSTGEPIGEPFRGHSNGVAAVALGELDGTPIVVTGSLDQTARVWDLTTGEPIGEPFRGHTNAVAAVALTELEGTPVLVTGSLDETARVWDLTTAEPLGRPFTRHTGSIGALVLGELDGVPVAVSGGADSTVRVWTLTSVGE